MSVNACIDKYGKFYLKGRKGVRFYYELSQWGGNNGLVYLDTKKEAKWNAKCFEYKCRVH
jgi:hypothetical protein